MAKKQTDRSTLSMEQKQYIAQKYTELCAGLDALPLGAVRVRDPNRRHYKVRYIVSFTLTMSQLCRLEKIVLSHANGISHFMKLLAERHLLVAHRKEVLRAFGYEAFADDDGLDDETKERDDEDDPALDGDGGTAEDGMK